MREWVDRATDAGNGQRSLTSVCLWVLAAVAFVVFAGGRARRVRTFVVARAWPVSTSTGLA